MGLMSRSHEHGKYHRKTEKITMGKVQTAERHIAMCTLVAFGVAKMDSYFVCLFKVFGS